MYRYFQNPFMTVTTGNFKKMLLMARDHRDKLSQYIADPDIQNCYNVFNAAFTHFEKTYSTVNVNVGFYRGNTLKVETFIQELTTNKIREWDILTSSIFVNNPTDYAMLFPQGRKPFQQGAYELKIDAVRTLNGAMARFPQLNTIQADVQDFLNKIDAARTAQQQAETLDQSLRQQLEDARVELALQMHYVFCVLLSKHYRNASDMSRYYELKYLQAPASTAIVSLSKYNIAAASHITLFDGLLTANSFITLKNTGNTILKVFTTNDAAAVAPSDVMELGVGEKYSFYAAELTDGLGYNWLVIVNDSNSEAKLEAGKEEIETE